MIKHTLGMERLIECLTIDQVKHCIDVKVSNIQEMVIFAMQFGEESQGKNSTNCGASRDDARLLRSAGLLQEWLDASQKCVDENLSRY